MMKVRNKIFKNPQLTLEGNMIKCENDTIQIVNISLMWMEQAQENTNVFLKVQKRRYDQLHIQMNSGTIYTFATDNPDIVQRTYKLLNSIIADPTKSILYQIKFDKNGEIKNQAAKKVTVETTKSTAPLSGINAELMSELHLLLSDYKEKTVVNEDIISLIGQTAEYIKKNDEARLKIALTKFLELGLINNCNELGLNSLIEEIKKRLF